MLERSLSFSISDFASRIRFPGAETDRLNIFFRPLDDSVVGQMLNIVNYFGSPTHDDLLDMNVNPEIRLPPRPPQMSIKGRLESYSTSSADSTLLEAMLVFSPKKRLSAWECLTSDFFQVLFRTPKLPNGLRMPPLRKLFTSRAGQHAQPRQDKIKHFLKTFFTMLHGRCLYLVHQVPRRPPNFAVVSNAIHKFPFAPCPWPGIVMQNGHVTSSNGLHCYVTQSLLPYRTSIEVLLGIIQAGLYRNVSAR
jgi:serine/threonine protein kinase